MHRGQVNIATSDPPPKAPHSRIGQRIETMKNQLSALSYNLSIPYLVFLPGRCFSIYCKVIFMEEWEEGQQGYTQDSKAMI